MNRKKREEVLKELTKKANEEFFKELMKEDNDVNDADLGGDKLKEHVRRILEGTEIHLPGESE